MKKEKNSHCQKKKRKSAIVKKKDKRTSHCKKTKRKSVIVKKKETRKPVQHYPIKNFYTVPRKDDDSKLNTVEKGTMG